MKAERSRPRVEISPRYVGPPSNCVGHVEVSSSRDEPLMERVYRSGQAEDRVRYVAVDLSYSRPRFKDAHGFFFSGRL